MRITIDGLKDDDGRPLREVYEDVTDMALVMCQFRPLDDRQTIRLLPLARARSIFGQYPRELVKEVQVVADELWDHLKELPRNGDGT